MRTLNPRHQRSSRNQIINNAYPNWLTNGVITALQNAPWVSTVDVTGLNIAYHARSGNKFISPIMYSFLDDDGEITQAGSLYVTKLLEGLYFQKWNKLWNAYTTQYDSSNTFQSTESKVFTGQKGITESLRRTPMLTTAASTSYESTRIPDLEINVSASTDSLRSPNITTTQSTDANVIVDDETTSTTQYGQTIANDDSSEESANHDLYAFNSTEAVPQSVDSKTVSSAVTTAHSGSDVITTAADNSTTTTTLNQSTETGNESTVTTENTTTLETGSERITNLQSNYNTLSGTDTHNNQSTETDSKSETVTKSGYTENPIHLMDYAREFWMINYFDIVFQDIDKALTLSVYSSGEINQFVWR